MFPEITEVFEAMFLTPQENISEEFISVIETFVILLYSTTNEQTEINMARNHMFTQGRQMDCIPPTKNALIQHIKQANYQGCFIWGNCLFPSPNIPLPSQMGWEKNADNLWQPTWMTIQEASKSCQELIKCGCKQRCGGCCKCTKAALCCTALYKCSGDCYVEHV